MKEGRDLDPVGALIANRYRVEQTLGRGGMAVVYRVLDQRTGKQLALKRCMARDPRKRMRYEALLEREYHTLAQLAHPRIIAVHDYGVDRSGPYYTMELLDSSDLERDERMHWRRVCALMYDVASSLAILHSRGLLHRDVSSRNVRFSSDGHAKLIDFGAMMSIGVATDTAGTPPFMAPEVLQLQALDGRVDLFALGALGYRLLTGRHAFPAKRVRDLRDIWRSRPIAPAALAPELPAELSSLLLQMLSLDRAGRPQNAAEVMERLRTVASLSGDDSAEVSRAYLTTPVLVGRDAALTAVRKRMLALVRGDGGVLLVAGESGSGRSRMLEACALEARLLGSAVVRADARDARNGGWGVVRTLASQLLEQLPEQAADAARLSRNVLAHVLDELQGDEPQTATGYAPERGILVRELREWILSLSKAQRLLIVVDDADRIDDASFALLTALAHKAERHALLLALSVEQSGPASSETALRLLQDFADTIELPDIQPQQTEALMRSLFGDVPNLPLCATRIHGLAQGNPRATMELAQHLVDTGRARYEAGSWSLPPQLDENDLPHTLAASLAARLKQLSPEARELAEALALADADALYAVSYPQLTDHRQVKRVFQALDELVAARVLSAGNDRYTFTQRGFLTVLCDTMPAARKQQVHLRIARLLTGAGGDALRRAHHLLAGGMHRDAIDLLCGVDLASASPPVGLLTAAVERAEHLGLPLSTLHRLRMAVLINAPFAVDYENFRRVVPVVLKQLEHDSGLCRYRELSHLPEGERLSAALSQAHQAYLNTPEHERVHTAFEAVRELARLSGSIASMALSTFDQELLESLPPLDPLFPLSPALALVAKLVEGQKLWLQGRMENARGVYQEILQRIAEPDRAGFDDAQHDRLRYGLSYMLGILEGVSACPSTEERARLLDGKRELRLNAWRIRALFQLASGNSAEARKCSRRSELLQAQDGLRERYVGTTIGVELALHARVGDLIAVKGLRDGVAGMGARYRGWRSVDLLARSYFCQLQGDLEGALEALESALALAPPLRLTSYTFIAGAHVKVLLQLGRVASAERHARIHLALAEEHDLTAPDLLRHGALALATAGDHAEALRVIGRSIERVEQMGAIGFALGVHYEARARIAIEMNDRQAFEAFAERCRIEYEKAKNPNLTARLLELFDRARERNVCPAEAAFALQNAIETQPADTEYETIHSRIAECVDSSDRGRCALTLLLQSTLSSVGYLFTLDSRQHLTLLAALPDPPYDRDMLIWLERFVTGWLEPSQMDEVTAADSGATTVSTEGSPETPRYVDPEGRGLQALPLMCDRPAGRTLAGVLVVEAHGDTVVSLSRSLTSAVASELLEYGDAGGQLSPT